MCEQAGVFESMAGVLGLNTGIGFKPILEIVGDGQENSQGKALPLPVPVPNVELFGSQFFQTSVKIAGVGLESLPPEGDPFPFGRTGEELVDHVHAYELTRRRNPLAPAESPDTGTEIFPLHSGPLVNSGLRRRIPAVEGLPAPKMFVGRSFRNPGHARLHKERGDRPPGTHQG